VVLHVLRHGFATRRESAGVPEPTIRQLIGHARPGITLGLYSHGADLKQLREAVQRITFRRAVDGLAEQAVSVRS